MEIFSEDIPILVDARVEFSFHDQSIRSDMEIIEHLVMDDLLVVGNELCIAKHLVVSNEITDVVSLACVLGDLHVTTNMGFVSINVEVVVAEDIPNLVDVGTEVGFHDYLVGFDMEIT